MKRTAFGSLKHTGDQSDHDLTILKNMRPDSKVTVIIKPGSDQLSIEDIQEERERNKEEKYKII
ncbi:MAG: hypothetical protein PWR10_1757 [Halanaerobiales bacterium]|nr:hypothetical protein [Halanaerobiales bacterium]